MNLGIKGLLSTNVEYVYRIRVNDGSDDFILDDSIVIADGRSLIHIIVKDNAITIQRVAAVNELIILEGLSQSSTKVDLVLVTTPKNRGPVNRINCYSQGSSYTFGMKLLDEEEGFIIGFSLGFDEIGCQDEVHFESMLQTYHGTPNIIVVR